ncbi:MAG: CDP-glucose 4,6-dehydratase [Verrucomicrobiales bacterium]|nr:CDP-glucose 4,6-dehydratase [Verrucomicrobiales bacterium]
MTDSSKQRVLVTGNLGFIGSWLSLKYLRSGFELYGFDNENSFGERLFKRAKLERHFKKQFLADVSDLESLQQAVKEIEPDLIIHLAGQAIVPRAFREPFYTYQTNTLGTLAVLESARTSPSVRSVICITSDKVYENMEQIWPYRETDQLGGKDIYSVSKSSSELLVGCYAKTHLADCDVNVQSVRLGNVVGGGDWSVDRLIPDLMRSIETDTPFRVRYADATRPFQHVLDVAEGIFQISRASLERTVPAGEGWNLGPRGNTYARVRDVITICRGIWPTLVIQEQENRVREDLFLSVDVTKLSRHFEEPVYTSLEALEQTFNWYARYLNGDLLEELIQNDFEAFESANSK